MKKQLDVVLLEHKVPVTMPDAFLNKVKYLCTQIARVEWSGILFYSITGSIKNIEAFSICLEDILPMDMGSSAFTSYELDSRYVEYMMDNPQAMEWYVGHIHSHNTMGVFFSGTDMEELHDNSDAHNFYLSLIVNNYMDFEAKIAFRGSVSTEIKNISYFALDENGQKYVIDRKTVSIKMEKLFTYNCTILSATEEIHVPKAFADKVKGIIDKKRDEVKQPVLPAYQKHPVKPWEKDIDDDPTWEYPDWKKHNPANNKPIQRKFPFPQNGAEKPPVNIEDTDGEKLAKMILNFAVIPGTNDKIEVLLDEIEIMQVTGSMLAKAVGDCYTKSYDTLFDFEGNEEEAYSHFVDTTNEVIEILEEFENDYPVLYQTVGFIKEMLYKFENYALTGEH